MTDIPDDRLFVGKGAGDPEPWLATKLLGAPGTEAPQALIDQPIVFDRITGKLSVGERVVRFSLVEANVLEAILGGEGRLVSKGSIFRAVWGVLAQGPTQKNIDVQVCKIRAKLRAVGLDAVILTAWGRGYSTVLRVEIVPPACQTKPLTDRMKPHTDQSIRVNARGITLLKALLRDCADRPATAELSERVRQEVFG